MKFTAVAFAIFIAGNLFAQEKDSLKMHRDQYNIGYSYDAFGDELSSWHTTTLGLKYGSDRWKIFPRLSISNRFDQSGFNFELDNYHTFKNSDYLLIDLGFSPQVIFPRFRAGIEYFNPFQEIWEHSIGVKYFNFDQTGNIILLTNSLSKYSGKHLSILRVNGALSLDGGDITNYGLALQHRYYRKDDAYLGVFGSYGFDTSLIIVGDNININQSDPYLISLGATYETRYLNRHKWTLTYAWTHYDFGPRTRNQHTFTIFYFIKRKGHESH